MNANERAAAAVVVAREASALHKNVQIHDSSCILRDFKLLSLLSLSKFCEFVVNKNFTSSPPLQSRTRNKIRRLIPLG